MSEQGGSFFLISGIDSIRRWGHLLCAGSLKQSRPTVGIEKLGSKLRGEIRIPPTRWIVCRHESDHLETFLKTQFAEAPPIQSYQIVACFFKLSYLRIIVPPHVPEPFTLERWHGEHSPVHKNPDLSLIEPPGQGTGVQRYPVRSVQAVGTENISRDARTSASEYP